MQHIHKHKAQNSKVKFLRIQTSSHDYIESFERIMLNFIKKKKLDSFNSFYQ